MKRALACLFVTFAAGLGVLAYSYGPGPGRAFVRGTAGDVLAAAAVYFGLTLVWRVRWPARAAAALAVGVGVELAQLLGMRGGVLLGATFDPWDLVAYAAGVALAAVVVPSARGGRGAFPRRVQHGGAPHRAALRDPDRREGRAEPVHR